MGAIISVLAAIVFYLLASTPSAAPRSVSHPPAITQKSPETLIHEARLNLGIDVVHSYNFAVTGQSGSGKSSLINAIRGLDDRDYYAAPVGEMETTMSITSYTYPKKSHIVFWDLPGAGTTTHPSSTYFKDKTLYAFDCLIIVTAGRLVEGDIEIAKRAKEWGVPIFFVRNKVDQDIASKRRRGVLTSDAKDLLRMEVSKTMIPQLTAAGLQDRKIYLVSAPAYQNVYDVPIMDEALLVNDIAEIAIQRRK